MEEYITEREIEHEKISSLEDIKEKLETSPREGKNFIHFESDRVSYTMGIIAFKYNDDFDPNWREVEEYCEGWYMIKPLRMRLLQGCEAGKFRRQTDLILNKIVKEVDYEDRNKGVFCLLRPEEKEKYGVVLVFDIV